MRDRWVLWVVIGASGCVRESVEGDDCVPGPVIRELALDEPSVTGAVPLEVLARVNRTVTGRFAVTRTLQEHGGVEAIPGSLALALAPTAAPADREAALGCDVIGVHLNLRGRLDVGFVASDGSGATLDLDGLPAELRVYDPDTIQILAYEAFDGPGWVVDLAATEPEFGPGAELETRISFTPWWSDEVFAPSLLSTDIALEARIPGSGVKLASWESDPEVGP